MAIVRLPGVMLVISDMGSGGAQQVASQLANHWVEQGREVSLLTFTDPRLDFFKTDARVRRIAIDGIKISRSFAEQIAHNFWRVRAIRRALREFAGDTVIGFIAPTNVLLILASIGLPRRIIISERNDPSRQSFGVFWDFMRRMTYRFADVVSANSRSALVALKAYVPAGKLVYLPNPLRQPVSAGSITTTRRLIILSVGRLHRQKGHDILIRAFARIAAAVPEWRLCIVGEGAERGQLQELIESLLIADRIDLIGQVDDPFVFYRSASIFAFPSRWEGTPNALLEAMSCGLPVVVSDAVPNVQELLQHGSDGLVIPSESEAALAEALLTLAKDEDLRARFGARAVEVVHKFAPQAALAAWDNAIWSRE